MRKALVCLLGLVLVAALAAPVAAADPEAGFVSLFNGTDLEGWTGSQYAIEDGNLVCTAEGGGMMLTEKEYSDFVFRFEFKLEPGGNNGVGIRAPLEGNPAYDGMELQILDDSAPEYANLRPEQYHGSIYDVVACQRGSQKPVGEWNTQEVFAMGPHIKVTLNGTVIVDADLTTITDEEVLKRHPGLMRPSGHLGFMGHGSRIEFRNLRILDLNAGPDNTAPEGFEALFNGTDLSGWKGLVLNPEERAKMPPEQLAEAQAKADEAILPHWVVKDGAIEYDGKADSLCTAKDYGDFEMLVDWKIEPGGDSGIYLRGSPQVQIWDRPDVGSGGLYNNQNNPSQPLLKADNPPGQWNRFRMIMVGEKVTVYLNGILIVDEVTMENYWDRNKPIYPVEQIELQHHGSTLWFKNIYIREIQD